MLLESIIIILLMTLAIVLALLEIFMLPGITVAGVCGIASAAGGLIYAYSVSTVVGHITLALSLFLFLLAFCWLLRSNSLNKVSLNTDVDSTLVSTRDLGIQPGDKGVTLSRLAPIGKAKIKDQVVEAKSLDELIDEKTPVRVVEVAGYQVIVQKEN